MRSVRNISTKRRFLRLLTVVCFFQFSGLNNGYAYVSVISPTQFPHAFSYVNSVSHNWVSGLRNGTLPFLQHSLKISEGLTQRIGRLAQASWKFHRWTSSHLKNIPSPKRIRHVFQSIAAGYSHSLNALTQKVSLTPRTIPEQFRSRNLYSKLSNEYILNKKLTWKKKGEKYNSHLPYNKFNLSVLPDMASQFHKNIQSWDGQKSKIIQEIMNPQFSDIPDEIYRRGKQ